MPKEPEELGDELCKWCPKDEEYRGVYSVPGGFAAGCEGSHCKEAYEAYLEECAEDTIEQNGHIAQQQQVDIGNDQPC